MVKVVRSIALVAAACRLASADDALVLMQVHAGADFSTSPQHVGNQTEDMPNKTEKIEEKIAGSTKATKHAEEKHAEKHHAEKHAEKHAGKTKKSDAEKPKAKDVEVKGQAEDKQDVNPVKKAMTSVISGFKGFFGKGEEEKATAGLLQEQKHVVQEGIPVKPVPSTKQKKHEKAVKKSDKKETSENNLPALKKVMGKSAQVLMGLNSKMEELKESLAEKEKESKATVRTEKAAYEKELKDQHLNSTHMLSRNKKLSAEVSELKTANTALRRKADRLKSQSAVLRTNLEGLQNNISTAQDFITGALERKEGEIEKLSILQELDDNETHTRMDKAHKQSLSMLVGDQKDVMLFQTENAGPSPDAIDYLRSLGARFEELDIQQNASMLELKETFDSEWAKEEKLQVKLEKEGESLMESKEAETKLHHRLHEAFVHLQETKTYLENRVTGLQSYASRVSKLVAKQ